MRWTGSHTLGIDSLHQHVLAAHPHQSQVSCAFSESEAGIGAVAIGPPPEPDREGSWLRVTFARMPTGQQGKALSQWFEDVSHAELEADDDG